MITAVEQYLEELKRWGAPIAWERVKDVVTILYGHGSWIFHEEVRREPRVRGIFFQDRLNKIRMKKGKI